MRRPFKCPVCGGRGIVPNGFYDIFPQSITSIIPETCKTCHGSGIIWGENITEVDFEDFQSDTFMYDINDENTSVT
jgi:DnaJ-class molecular chaperone